MSEEAAIAGEEVRAELPSRNRVGLILNAMRPYQWVKNSFILAPLLFGKKLADPVAVGNALIAFVVFCFLASALYIFNDWIDIEEDRSHPEKRHRPMSSGLLSVPLALSAAVVLTLAALSLAAYLGTDFFLIAATYVALTLCYCLFLKRVVVLDAMTISAGFVIRVIGGAVAIGVFASHWLISCAFLLAMFLAFSKRRQELLLLSDADAGNHRKVLSEYTDPFLRRVNTILIGSSIVCYALYTVAPETVTKFGTTNLIYGTTFVIYGMLRYMFLIEDPINGGNPTRMLLKDRPLQLTVIGWTVFNAIVLYWGSIMDVLGSLSLSG